MRKNVKDIVIVCTGNTCRSVMAEGYLIKRLRDIGRADINVSSAGTAALPGAGPSRGAESLMNERGIDISAHESHPITVDILRKADIILVMEEHQRESVLSIFPAALDKLYLALVL